MSAVRQAIAALWAAVWVRWRLLAVRVRRLLGGGDPAAAAGSGHYLSPAEIPVDGVDYELIDPPPELAARLDAARADLLDHARATTASRSRRTRARRRRTASVAAAAVLSLGVLGAGASALVSGSTGVPAVDRLLGIYEAGLEKPGAEGRPGPAGRDLQPAPASAAATVAVPLGDGRRLTSAVYIAVDGQLCSALTVTPGESGDLVCAPPAVVRSELESMGGEALGVSESAGGIVVRGLVDAGAGQLAVTGPHGPLDVHLGEKALLPGMGGARAFVAIGDHSAGEGVDPSEYRVHVTP